MPVTEMTRLRRERPMIADRLVADGARVARGSGPAKWLQSALDKDASRIRRYRNGSDPHSPFATDLALHYRLATASRVQAWTLIAEEVAVVTRVEIERASVDELYARLRELDERQHNTQGREDAATWAATMQPTPENQEYAADCDIADAALKIERAAIRRELATRPDAQAIRR